MTPGQARPPVPAAQACQVIAVETTPNPALDSVNDKSSKDLLTVCRSVLEGSTELIKFVDQNREAARNAGVETIAIELSGILEGGSVSRVRDTLEESIVKSWPAQVTHEGLAKLRRAESLLADATRELDKEVGIRRGLGQSDVGVTWWPFVVVGALAAAAGAYFISQTAAPPVAVPQYRSPKKLKPLSGSESKTKKK